MINVGIDLGTTNSVCAWMNEQSQIQYIQFDNNILLPSYLYDDGNHQYVGMTAKNRGLLHPQNVISSAKRHMDDLSYQYTIGGHQYTPQDVATEVLKKIYQEIQKQIYQDNEINAMITVPANFRDSAISATIHAGKNAGFHDVRILKEPIASVIAHGYTTKEMGNFMVVDLGGGTLDISIINVQNRRYNAINVAGDVHLGGDDFTKIIQNMIEEEILNNGAYGYLDFSVDHIDDNSALKMILKGNEELLKIKAKIAEKSEQAKIALSVENETTVDIPRLFQKNGENINFQMTIKREDFEKRANRLFKRFEDAIEDAMNVAYNHHELAQKGINKVIFAGGSMNLPKTKQIVQKLIQMTPIDGDLDRIVATGAAIYAASVFDGSIPVPDPVEEVTGVLPYHIGVRIVTGELNPILMKDTQYPTGRVTSEYQTVEDYQTSIYFEVYEGNVLENAYDVNNKKIFEFTVNGLRSQLKGEAKVLVTFEIDENGMLYIHAEDEEGIAPSYDNRDQPLNWNIERKV